MKEIIITASVLILCVMLIRHFFKGKISNRLQYALWLLVAIRLIIPVSAQLYLSLGEIDEFRIMDLVRRLEGRFRGYHGASGAAGQFHHEYEFSGRSADH